MCPECNPLLPSFLDIFISPCINNRKDTKRQNRTSNAITTSLRETTQGSCHRSDSRPASTCNPTTTTDITSPPPFATKNEQATPSKAQSITVMRPTSTVICIMISIGIGCIRLLSHIKGQRRRTSIRRSMCPCLPGSNSMWRKGPGNDCP